MVPHGVKIIFICILISIFMLLPYFPGEYDHLAVMLSSITQVTAFISLLFVPVGILWLIYEKTQKKKVKHTVVGATGFAIVTLAVSTITVIAASMVAIGGIGSFRGSIALGSLLIISYTYIIVSKIIPRIKQIKKVENKKPSIIPFYMVIIPLFIISLRCILIPYAIEYSTNHAIQQSSILIQELEDYYSATGQYPVSLQGVWKDYSPSVLGIERYYYEPNGSAYNLFFEQLAYNLFVREIVMYNKLDEHIIRSHPSFIFRLTLEAFEDYRGFFSETELQTQHWKSFLFD